MPLSDHEQRVLEQMERALAAEDPKFASTFHGAIVRRRNRRRLLLACTSVVVGLAVLLSAVVVEGIASRLALQIVVALVGFVVMLAGAYYAVVWARPGLVATEDKSHPRGHSAPQRSDDGFMNRFEQRWHRRRDGDF